MTTKKDIYSNIKEFSKLSNLERTIVSILAGLTIEKAEYDNLKQIFLKLDVDKNGKLSKQEILNGLRIDDASS